ncbi:MAG: D-tyrosyl-tRNA(Tyr) deacylase [Planctomycetes bacterium]|nr:D-tyrosyl-tRNA(Tyr) deacylase [Planctomycetota bacterium]
MRVVIQRVARASVAIAGVTTAAIDRGLLVLVGITEGDSPADVQWLSGKIARLRIFPDDDGAMNRSVADIGGGVLVVSQFTLFASTANGNRPAFLRAARRETALPLYRAFIDQLTEDLGHPPATGEFAADMQVSLINDGPVTITIDTQARE